MDWDQILSDAGLTKREVDAIKVLSKKPNLKASEIAKSLLDVQNKFLDIEKALVQYKSIEP